MEDEVKHEVMNRAHITPLAMTSMLSIRQTEPYEAIADDITETRQRLTKYHRERR